MSINHIKSTSSTFCFRQINLTIVFFNVLVVVYRASNDVLIKSVFPVNIYDQAKCPRIKLSDYFSLYFLYHLLPARFQHPGENEPPHITGMIMNSINYFLFNTKFYCHHAQFSYLLVTYDQGLTKSLAMTILSEVGDRTFSVAAVSIPFTCHFQ